MNIKDAIEFEYIFNPRAVALIGASSDNGYAYSLSNSKLWDRLYFVNPRYDELSGKKCYHSVLDIPVDIDFVIIAVPAIHVPKILAECIEKGVKAAHVFTAGFSETGITERIKLENEVRDFAKGKIRLIGPNCMGIYCSKSGLSFTWDASFEEGPVGVISQSGTFGVEFLNIGKIRNLKFSKVVSYGNAIDLDCPDFLEYLADDPDTKIIALYMEGTKNGRRLKSALAHAAGKKPVLALKGGVTEHGSRAASSHTGSLAGSPEIWSSIFRQTGVAQVEDFDELLNAALALTYAPYPAGKGTSIITNSGGFSVLETDVSVKAGLAVPQFTQETLAQLRKIVPVAGTSISNPLDAWPIFYNLSGTEGNLGDVIKILSRDKNIHSIILHMDEINYLRRVLGPAFEGHFKEVIGLMLNGCKYARDEMGKPVMLCISMETFTEDEEDRRYHLIVKKTFEDARIPVFPTLRDTINALFNLYRIGLRFSKKHEATANA
ncbi:MAG: CoA-binding protein [Chloroflexota bacterium]|nr:MAG: CoA-binding protein [Chloroflexota bacterium]